MSVLKFCSCRGCKAGRHCRSGKAVIRDASRKLRHETKAALRRGVEPPKAMTVGMTD